MPDDKLPGPIVESMAIINTKCIAGQPAIYSNLSLANQVFNTNLQQQMMVSQSQAMSQITMATAARCIALVTGGDAGSVAGARTLAEALNELLAAIKDQPVKTPHKPAHPPGGEDGDGPTSKKEAGSAT